MPPKKVALSDEVRVAFKAQLAEAKRVADQSMETFHIQVYLMNRSGLTFDEIADIFGTKSSTVSGWKAKGEEAYRRGESTRDRSAGQDSDRPGQRIPVS